MGISNETECQCEICDIARTCGAKKPKKTKFATGELKNEFSDVGGFGISAHQIHNQGDHSMSSPEGTIKSPSVIEKG